MHKPDYGKLVSVDEVDAEITRRRDAICRKVKQQAQVKETKKQTLAGLNEQIREVGEELNHEIGVLDELVRRRGELEATPLFSRAAGTESSSEERS